MKRDMELVRQILLAIERSPDPDLRFVLDIAGTDHKTSHAHYLLLMQAGLVHAIDRSSHGDDYISVSLTWHGHDLLDAIRDEERWQEISALASRIGYCSADMLVELARGLALEKAAELGCRGASSRPPSVVAAVA